MPLLKKIQTIAAKVETTIGTPITLAAADGVFNAWDIDLNPEIDVERREAQGSFDSLPSTVNARIGKMTFKSELGWSGTGLPSWASILLPACGYVASSQVLTPRSEAPGSNVKTLTMGAYINGLFKSIAGAMGTFKIVGPTGKRAYIEWEFTGVWQPPIDTAIIAPTYPTGDALRFAEVTLTYNAVEQCIANFMLDAGNKVVMRECPSTAAGYISALVTDREPKITLDPEAQLVATEDRHGYWMAGSEYALSCAIGGPSDSILTIAAPKAQIVSLKQADREGLLIDEVDLMCNKNDTAKDEQVSITFTDETP